MMKNNRVLPGGFFLGGAVYKGRFIFNVQKIFGMRYRPGSEDMRKDTDWGNLANIGFRTVKDPWFPSETLITAKNKHKRLRKKTR